MTRFQNSIYKIFLKYVLPTIATSGVHAPLTLWADYTVNAYKLISLLFRQV